jgi:hypothetical protein
MLNKVLSSLGLMAGVIGAFMVASNAGLFLFGYLLFFSSSTAWIIYAARTKQMNLLIMNIIFGVINAMGIYNFS